MQAHTGFMVVRSSQVTDEMEAGENERDTQNAEHNKCVKVPEVLSAICQEMVVADKEKQASGQKQAEQHVENRAPVKRDVVVICHAFPLPAPALTDTWSGCNDVRIQAVTKCCQVLCKTVGELASFAIIGGGIAPGIARL